MTLLPYSLPFRAIFLGLDLSLSSSGVAWQECYPALHRVWPLCGTSALTPDKGKMNAARLDSLGNQLEDILSRLKLRSGVTTFAAVEDYARGGSGQRHSLAEWGGLARVILSWHGVKLLVVNPSTLKLFTTGHGHADKGQMARAMESRTGQTFPTDDECDAAALLYFLRCRVQAERPADLLLRGQDKQTQALWKPKWALDTGNEPEWRKKAARSRA